MTKWNKIIDIYKLFNLNPILNSLYLYLLYYITIIYVFTLKCILYIIS